MYEVIDHRHALSILRANYHSELEELLEERLMLLRESRGENAGLLQVERLSSFIAAVTDYHHGTGSMASTIVGLANNYPGSNNLNLFVPIVT